MKNKPLEPIKTIKVGEHKGINHAGECHDKHLKQIKEQWSNSLKAK